MRGVDVERSPAGNLKATYKFHVCLLRLSPKFACFCSQEGMLWPRPTDKRFPVRARSELGFQPLGKIRVHCFKAPADKLLRHVPKPPPNENASRYEIKKASTERHCGTTAVASIKSAQALQHRFFPQWRARSRESFACSQHQARAAAKQ